MTAPYKINEKTREFYRDEVLISTLNPKNLKGIERKLFNHELIYLNPNYKGEDTPQKYRDWLDLIYESIHNPENPNVNIQNEGVKRAVEIVSYENIDPYEWEESKKEAGRRKVLKLEIEEAKINIARKMIHNNEPDQKIADYTDLSIAQIQQIRDEIE
jgi:hypothetical protein